MPQSKIANKEAKILPSKEVYNDRDRINDLLISYKHLAYMYSLAMQEASNPKLYQSFAQLFEESSQMQRATYNLMFEKGWKTLEKLTQEKIKTTHKNFTQQANQLEEI